MPTISIPTVVFTRYLARLREVSPNLLTAQAADGATIYATRRVDPALAPKLYLAVQGPQGPFHAMITLDMLCGPPLREDGAYRPLLVREQTSLDQPAVLGFPAFNAFTVHFDGANDRIGLCRPGR